ncbi:capsule assembly Wzi family protein [soil metagenome]
MMCLKTNTILLITLLLPTGLFIIPFNAFAQLSPPEMSFETYGIVSSSGTTPFWLQSNRHGMFASDGSHVMTRFQVHGSERFGGGDSDRFTFHYGADFITRPGVQSTATFNQGFLRLDAYGLYLQAGRFHNTSPIHDEELGMGSLGVSGNAPPIPQIRVGLADWTSIPFTSGFVQIRGHLAHGWMENGRFASDVLYHEKVGHAKIGGNFWVNVYGGLAQYAFWGGTMANGTDIPNDLSDFGRVFFALKGGENAPIGMQNYAYGNHRGGWNFGFFLEFNELDINVYRQFPLETRDNLKLKSYMDALTGISIDFGADLNIPDISFVYEYLYTKYQDGHRRPNDNPNSSVEIDPYRGNENYYNHHIYRTGWVYNNRTIGNPLFIPSSDPRIGVFNNRIVGHHLGLKFRIAGNILLTTRGTFSRNYGKRWDNRVPEDPEKTSLFNPSIDQWSLFAGMQAPFTWNNQAFTLLGEIGVDNGALVGNQIGMTIGLRWSPN